MKSRVLRRIALMSSLALAVVLLGVSGGAATASSAAHRATGVRTSTMGPFHPTFVGPAATGCARDCSLLTGPFNTPSTAAAARGHSVTAPGQPSTPSHARALVPPNPRLRALSPAQRRRLARSPSFPVPSVSCVPLGAGCDRISTSPGGATGVKGLNAVDSAEHTANPNHDVEPPDQGLCAGNGYVVEANNIGEMLVFNTALQRKSAPISLDSVMGLTRRGWSSGGDPSCLYDSANGGHWFFTEIVSATTEKSGGPFSGCFAAQANTCYEGIAVSDGANPFGPYHVYFANADYNPAEPGYPYLLNDFAKISVTRDAFLMFYDEFPLNGSQPGFGGGIFNGAQEFAFRKSALEQGQPVELSGRKPNPDFTVARENMGLLRTPDGTCARDKVLHQGGITCWVAVIPAQPADAGQFDNSHGGTGFMFGTLDFYGFYPLPTSGDNRVAAWAWTGLSGLNSTGCSKCGGIRFRGELFSGVDRYYEPEGLVSPQKSGPIPLGDECGAAGLSTGSPPPASCPEGGIATNGDFSTQVSQAQNQLWTATTTEVGQTYTRANAEIHQGAVYWVIGTKSFDTSGKFTLTNQGYVTAQHEDMEMPAVAAEGTGGNGKAILLFTLNGNGGPTGADHGGFYPSTAFGRLTSTSKGLLNSTINIADMGKSPQDGFTEYQGYPGPTRPRWGDYSWGVFLPGSGGRIYFANEYIQYPNCTGHRFTLTIATCGGTRDGLANWGTSVNYVVP
jgi:hypothetical protein